MSICSPSAACVDEIGKAPMDMIGHGAVLPNREPDRHRLLGQEIEIDFVIAVLKEDRLAPVAALGHMMRPPRDHDSRQSPANLPSAQMRGTGAPNRLWENSLSFSGTWVTCPRFSAFFLNVSVRNKGFSFPTFASVENKGVRAIAPRKCGNQRTCRTGEDTACPGAGSEAREFGHTETSMPEVSN